SFSVYAANEGWKNCDDDGIANCEYQIKDGVLTVRPQDNSQPASIPDYERDGTYTRYFESTSSSPFRWDENADTVTTLKIESGISSIGTYAFEDMGFTTVQLPESLTSIKQSAFLECDYLSNVNLPSSLREIARSAFGGTSLTNVVIPAGTEDNPTIVGTEAFRGASGANRRGVYGLQLESFVAEENTILDEKIFLKSNKYPLMNLENFKMYCAEGNQSCVNAIAKTVEEALARGLIDSSKTEQDYLKIFTKDGNGFYQIDDKLYATADLMTHNAACDDAANCQAILDAASQGKPFEVGGKYYATLDLFANGAACTDKKNCEDILSSNGNPFKVGSKIYNSMADFANGNYVKHRIYTIEEANFVAGPVNRVSIKYR
ncbi:MAG: leucine-rich repeat domain-containing protein, partial [Alphaproteobacteria bacterium]|nr:leucine-rich repeat domain-containing protein [Alphaproteobacteria bacterium]